MAIDVSFGLDLAFLAIGYVVIAKEMLMNNTIAVLASVWCGVEFLRGLVVSSNPNERCFAS